MAIILRFHNPVVRAVIDSENGSQTCDSGEQTSKIAGRRFFLLMYDQNTVSAAVTTSNNGIDTSIPGLTRREPNPIAPVDILGAQLFRIERGPRVAMLIHHSVAALVFGSHPVHLRVHPVPHQLQHGGRVKSRSKHGIIEAFAYGLCVMRMAVQLAADIQHVTTPENAADRARTSSVLADQPHQQPPMCGRIGRGIVLAVFTPVAIVVPIDKSDQVIVDLIHEPPHPVEPEGLKTFDSGSADERLAPI